MMDVGLISWHDHENIGSNLQSYALLKTITDLGYSCEYINYSTIIKNKKNMFKTNIKLNIDKLRFFLPKKIYKDISIRYSVYQFQKRYIKKSKRYTERNITLTNNKYKMFLSGSDQIWAPNVFDKNLMLSFANEEKYKASYASSIGLNSIPKELIKYYIDNLSKYSAISVREEQGKIILEEILNREVKVVLDPTLLLSNNEWRKLENVSAVTSNKYIFCYFLSENKKMREIVKELGKKHNLEIIIYSKYLSDKEYCDKHIDFFGPYEWLAYVDLAQCIFTDSYHGVLLSLNLNKQFYCFKRFNDNDKLCQNSRLYQIINKFDLNNQLIEKNKEINFNEKIDYSRVNKIIDEERKYSIYYLKMILKEGCK